MVSSITSLTGNGLKDWLWQRISALYLAVYTVVLLRHVFSSPSYAEWIQIFHCQSFKIASGVSLLMLSVHTWVGIWTITTDYLKSTLVRLSAQVLVAIWLLAQFFWAFFILWGQ